MKAVARCLSRNANHPLDYPIWTALTTTQQALAEGDARARRFPTEITPFAATADMSPESFAALGALMSPQDIAVLFTPDPVKSACRIQGRAGGHRRTDDCWSAG